MNDETTFTAFLRHRRVADGTIDVVAHALITVGGEHGPVLIFDDTTGRPVELDLRFGAAHAADDFRTRSAPVEAVQGSRGRGRPRLGVVAREVTLLPRHWDWLAGQPGGASAALRRLVEDARRSRPDANRARETRDAAYRVMSALGGDLPGFEDASRALFAGDLDSMASAQEGWPPDIRDYVRKVLGPRS